MEKMFKWDDNFNVGKIISEEFKDQEFEDQINFPAYIVMNRIKYWNIVDYSTHVPIDSVSLQLSQIYLLCLLHVHACQPWKLLDIGQNIK